MTIRFTSIHTTSDGDTLEALVEQYRLSSERALLEIEPNESIRERLKDGGALPAGLMVHIPPNAVDLVRERQYRLHEIRPVMLSHFDTMVEIAEADLRPALEATSSPVDSADVSAVLAKLGEYVAESVSTRAANTRPLVDIAVGMSLTHVATDMDRAAANAANDPRCGLYWSITPLILEQWEGMWNPELWRARWGGAGAGDPWGSASQYNVTIRSIVVQQVDTRIREAQTLERQLRSE